MDQFGFVKAIRNQSCIAVLNNKHLNTWGTFLYQFLNKSTPRCYTEIGVTCGKIKLIRINHPVKFFQHVNHSFVKYLEGRFMLYLVKKRFRPKYPKVYNWFSISTASEVPKSIYGTKLIRKIGNYSSMCYMVSGL